MKTRCLCATSKAYQYYGGRGITVCEEWRDSYEAFQAWAIANEYQDDLEIDRKDVNGNYEPSNCRWATRRQQMANTRKRVDGKTSQYKGVAWNRTCKKWRAMLMTNGKNLHLGLFDSEEEAARAYDAKAIELRGRDFAHVNFPISA